MMIAIVSASSAFMAGIASRVDETVRGQSVANHSKLLSSEIVSTLTVIDFHIETVRVQSPVNYATAWLESALNGFNRTINSQEWHN
jgi:hypothetical protein